MYNGYPVYRKQDSEVLIYMHNPSGRIWVIQALPPSAEWLANAQARGDSPDTASWAEEVMNVTLVATESPTNEPTAEPTVVAFNVVHRDARNNGIYDNSTGEMYNGYPVYRKQDSEVLIYMHNPSGRIWVIQALPPSAEWLANAHARGDSPDTASWAEEI